MNVTANRILGLLLVALLSTAAHAQITVANSVSDSSDPPGTSIACPAMNVASGHLISIFFRQSDDTTLPDSVTDTAGNTYNGMGQCDISGVGGDALTHYYAENVTGNAANVITVTWAAPHNFRAISCYDISGAVTSGALDQVATGRASSTSSVSTASYTTTQADEIILAGVGTGSLTANYTPDTGYTLDETVPSKDAASESKVVSTIQTGITTSMSMDDTSNMCIVAATFKASGTPPPATTAPSYGTIF